MLLASGASLPSNRWVRLVALGAFSGGGWKGVEAGVAPGPVPAGYIEDKVTYTPELDVGQFLFPPYCLDDSTILDYRF